MTERRMINLNPAANAALEEKLELINKARAALKKKQINRNDLIALAVDKLTIKNGLSI